MNNKIKTREEIREIAEQLKKQGKKIVTINGTFDIIHAGHIKILTEAKNQGDVLILGLNSDQSVRQNKGPTRPINSQENRAEVLAALEMIDYLTIFEETTPIEFLKIIKPDVHANGSEYGENCIEAPTVKQFGGRIHIIDLKPGLSTSDIIRKIKEI